MNQTYILVENCVNTSDLPYNDRWEDVYVVRGFYSSAELACIAMRILPEGRNEALGLPDGFVCSLSIYRVKQDIIRLCLDLSIWEIIDQTVDYAIPCVK